MKKFVIILLVSISLPALAQEGGGVGVKGGLNYNQNGDFSAMQFVDEAENNIGFHVGVFAKVDAGPIYIRPELLYTRTSSEYEFDDLIVSKIDVPLLVGLDILGPISVFAGPSFQYILDTEFEDITVNDPENKFTVGAQMGVGLNFNNFGIDIRYERGLSENEATIAGVPDTRVDTRPEQIIVGISVKL